MTSPSSARTASSEVRLANGMRISRMGFGSMRLAGPEAWGPPADRVNAHAVLRRAVERGVEFIDTADAYGPGDNEVLIREALHPYSARLKIATKVGLIRSRASATAPIETRVDGSAAHIRQAVEGSLRRLGLDCIAICQLHRVDPDIAIEDTVGVLDRLRTEGKISHIGLSEVSVPEIERARAVTDILTVQNRYSVLDRRHEATREHCERNRIGFIPFFPLGGGRLLDVPGLRAIAATHDASPAQVALAWLLNHSPGTILIPGTSNLKHLEQNIAAAGLDLRPADIAALDSISDRR